jgi:hypothetical protein
MDSQWKKVIFSDETKINMWQSDMELFIHENSQATEISLPPNTRMTKKFGGGSLMIWSCMTSRGVGYASQVLQKTMDSDCYIETLGTSFKGYFGLTTAGILMM